MVIQRDTDRQKGALQLRGITHDCYSMIFSMVESNSYDYIVLVLYNIVTIYMKLRNNKRDGNEVVCKYKVVTVL
jgi:hypothetical protein